MTDVLRFAQPMLLATAGAILFLLVFGWLIVSVMKKTNVDTKVIKYVKWIRNLLIIILLIALGWQLFIALSVNTVDRSVIDRSGLDFSHYPTATPSK